MKNKRNNSDKNPRYWRSMADSSQQGLFVIMPMIPRLMVIAIVCAIYYYFLTFQANFSQYLFLFLECKEKFHALNKTQQHKTNLPNQKNKIPGHLSRC